jgi:hypothetical protein
MDMNLVVGIVLGLTVVFVFGICLFGDWAAKKRRERDSEDFREHQGQIPTNVPTAVVVLCAEDAQTGVVVHDSC